MLATYDTMSLAKGDNTDIIKTITDLQTSTNLITKWIRKKGN